MTDKSCAALAYGLNLLRLLRSMALISEVEYQRIFRLQVEHYDPQKSYVWFLNSCHSRWMYANSCGILRVAAEESGYHKAERSAERRSA